MKPSVNASSKQKRIVSEFVERKPQKKWRTQGDDFRTFLHEFLSASPEVEIPAEFGL
jgi:hypothetical protein